MALSQRIYYINTLLKDSGTNEDFSYTIKIPSTERYDRVVLLHASIPNTFYLIQEGIDTFVLREMGEDITINIPPGNYSAKVFAAVISGILTGASKNGWIYNIALPNQNIQASTGRFTYTVTGNLPEHQPSIICTDKVNEQLGFQVFSTNQFANGRLDSTTIVNFGSEATMFIRSDIANNGDNDILQEIYSGNTINLAYITYQCTAPELYSKALKTNQSNTFRFSLTNEKNQLLNLHGVDMLLTLCLYKRDDTNELIRRYIKYKAAGDKNAGNEENNSSG